MRRSTRFWGLGAVLTLGAALMLLTTFASAASSGGAQHVRWDIISFVGGAPPTFNPGGYADAKAPDNTYIRLTGSGTFVAPGGSNGGSGAVTGGGTWKTYSGPPSSPTTLLTGSGTYTVEELVRWVFDNWQVEAAPLFTVNDNTGDTNERANGTAVLRIAFLDGTGVLSTGVLTVGCHGPGADPGIFEGIATTKGYKTYYDVQPPTAGVDANRTIFHVRR